MLEKIGPQVINKRGQTALIGQPQIRTERKFATYHVMGENAALRKIDIDSPADIDNMWDIEQSKGMKEELVESNDDLCKTKGELRNWIRGKSYNVVDPKLRHERSYVNVFAVTKSDRFPGEPHKEGWSPEVEGWLRVDASSSTAGGNEERHRYERVMGTTLPRTKDYPSPAELSYIRKPKNPDKTEEHSPKLMESAVRQMCHMIAAQDGEVNRNFYEPDGTKPKRIVMAFVRVGNEASRSVLEAAGFKLEKSGVVWDEKRPNKKSDMYVLDWDEYHRLMDLNSKESEKELMRKIASFLPETSAQKMTSKKKVKSNT
jgi:hypothetical protein